MILMAFLVLLLLVLKRWKRVFIEIQKADPVGRRYVALKKYLFAISDSCFRSKTIAIFPPNNSLAYAPLHGRKNRTNLMKKVFKKIEEAPGYT